MYSEAAAFAEGRTDSVGLLLSLQVIIQARKPDFFEHQGMSLFEIVSFDIIMLPASCILVCSCIARGRRWQCFWSACRQATDKIFALLRSQRMG